MSGGTGAAAGSAGPSVVVAVLTYRRPVDLAELLPQLVRQAQGATGVARATVLVVDNDPDGGGRSTCEELGLPGVRYVHEPRPGIAAARNRALLEARDEGLLVFVDDDERPCEGWLQLFCDVWAASRPCGVVGPVVSAFAGPLDPWIRAGGFFERRRLSTGTPVDVAATNNLLLDVGQVRRAGVTFDERFGLSGGSDTLFTRQLVAAGGRLLWCDEAVVTDVVPAARATRGWVLRRAVRSGNSWSRTALALAGEGPRLGRRGVLLLRGAVRLAGGAARLAAGVLLRDPRRRARGARSLARGVGMAGGACGWTYSEYRRPALRPASG